MASQCPGSDYFDSMNAILHPTLKTAILVLRIRTKDPTLTTNYRPISLLSIHYKLASCAITQRDKPRMTDLIGRHIINLISMVKHVNEKRLNALILLINFKKKTSTQLTKIFMTTALKAFNFGEGIIK